MSQYGDFAEYYDYLTDNIDYSERTDYLLSLFDKFNCKPTTLLDLACGTGSIAAEFAKKGIEVIGVDISADMLSRATAKTEGLNVLLLCQDITELDLYGTINSAVCILDSINHITEYNRLISFFTRLSLFMEKDGIFIFDVNTKYKHEKILGNNTFVFDTEFVYLVWANEYRSRSKIVDITLDFFIKEGEQYRRFTENITEKAYTHDEIKLILAKTGFNLLGYYGDMTTEKPKTNSDRNVYVVRKI